MTPSNENAPNVLIEMTVDVVSAFVSNNAVSAADLPTLISKIHTSLGGLGLPVPAPEPEKQLPAVSIKKSVTDDYLISLEDGKHYKSLKRHLSGRGLTPEQYREKWGLPFSYPMVAPSYAKQRSELAKALGLGQQRRNRPAKPTPLAEPVAAPAKRGRPKKA